MAEQAVDIIPGTKISQLLDAYPELEPVLIELAPAFKKLRNPVLRKTVAKLATLAQAAKIGKIPIEELVNTLRKKAGMEPITVALSAEVVSGEPPDWFDQTKIVKSLDGGPLLDAGEFPLTRVLDDLKNLQAGQCYEFLAPFVPSPLIDKVMQKGFACWVNQDNGTEGCRVYFTRLI